MHAPNLDEVLRGAFHEQEKNFYYTSYMKYPKKGGFRSLLDKCREGLDIRFNKEVTHIDPDRKTISFRDGTSTEYTRLISSLPLPEIVKFLPKIPDDVKKAANGLMHTSGYMVSMGFARQDVARHLWFYIYDENIMPARVYSPNLKSLDNVPEGCSSLQAEVFFSNRSKIPDARTVMDNTIRSLVSILKSDVLVPIQTGCELTNELFDDILHDNIGDNISLYNPYIAEFSGIYWVWKNYEK